MKLRILNNSIRFRLSMSDLRKLVEEGNIYSKLHLSKGIFFSFGIQTDQNTVDIVPISEDNNLSFKIPVSRILQLWETNEVGLYESLEISEKDTLQLTIEKDFKCLTPRSEDETDLFPNPREHH